MAPPLTCSPRSAPGGIRNPGLLVRSPSLYPPSRARSLPTSPTIGVPASLTGFGAQAVSHATVARKPSSDIGGPTRCRPGRGSSGSPRDRGACQRGRERPQSALDRRPGPHRGSPGGRRPGRSPPPSARGPLRALPARITPAAGGGSERTDAPREVCELALAHVNRDRVEAAYRRSDLFERRRELMESWSAFLGR